MQNITVLALLITGTTEAASSEVQPMTSFRFFCGGEQVADRGHRVGRLAPGVG